MYIYNTYIYIYIYILPILPFIVIMIHINLPVNAIVRLPHHGSGDSQSQEMFLVPFTDKQTGNYDTE